MTNRSIHHSPAKPTGNVIRDGMFTAKRPTGPLVAIVVLAVFMVLGQILFGGALLALGIDEPTKDTPMSLGVQMTFTVAFLGPLLLLFAWLRWKERRPLASLGFHTPGAGGYVARGAVVALLFLAVIVLANVLTGQAHFSGGFHAAQVAPALIALLGFTIQGSTEEVFTRGHLTQAVDRRWGLVAAVTVQSVFFTAMHLTNGGITVLAVVNLVMVAVFLSFWSLAEGGLWGVCAFHAVWNWAQGNIWGVEVSNMQLTTKVWDFVPEQGSNAVVTGGSFGLEGSVLTTALLVMGSAVALRAYRKNTRTAA